MKQNEEIKRSPARLAVLEKIAEYERIGLFDCDIEEDPATRELLPDEIEYIEKTVWQKIKTRFAFFLAYRYADKLERKREYSIKEIIGLENLSVSGGAIITANHFSPQDSFIMNRVFDASKRDGNFYITRNFRGYNGKK